MSTITLLHAKVKGTVSGNSPQIMYYPEAASQSFKKGQFVYLSSGKVTACANDASAILGMAVIDATGTTDTSIPVYVANGDTLFEGNVYYDGDADADDITAITQVGTSYALVVVSDKCHVDISDTTNIAFIVKAISKKDNVGDYYGRVIFDVIPSVAQLRSDIDTDT